MRIPVRLLALALVAGPFFPAWAASYAPGVESARVVLRVDDAKAAAAFLAGGAEQIADYGAFQLLAVNEAGRSASASQPGVTRVSDANRIWLNAGSVDTASAKANTARAALNGLSGRRLHLVQFAGPVKPEWLDAVTAAGLQVVDYIPNNAYLVYGEDAAIQGLSAVRSSKAARLQWDGAYTAQDKVQPRAVPTDASGARRALATDHFAIQMVNDPSANAATESLLAQLQLSAPMRRTLSEKYLTVITRLNPEQVWTLADRPDVISINLFVPREKFDERQNMIVSGNLAGNLPSGPGYLNWLFASGFAQTQFTASAFAVNVTDSGIDNGTSNVNHFGLFVGGTTANQSRVLYNRVEGTPSGGSTLQGCDGHGTINAHIIGGYVSLTNFPHTDAAGYRYGLGVCPFVKLGSSVIFDPDSYTFPDLENLISRAYRDGARISSDSWGANVAGDYDTEAQAYDALVRDAQPTGSAVPVIGNQQMTIVFAAGNAGPGAQTIGSPGTAKNVLTVGAAENVHSHSTVNGGNNVAGDDGCGTDDLEADSAADMVNFSSRGPCADSRVKPEIVAPGTHVSGGVAQQIRSMAGNGDDIACFKGTGVCRLPGGGTVGDPDNFFPSGQQFYSTSSGTSHSTPAVAGGCALTRQWFLNYGLNAPSPAMIKAYLVSVARYMNGTGANDSLFSNSQGFGGMDLGRAFDLTPRILRDQLTNDLFTAAGQARYFTAVVASNTQPVRISVSWTDAPGSTTGNAYKNDLDLSVWVDGVLYRGNVFVGSNSVTGGSADPRNNTESVFLPVGTTGSVVVAVTAANINSDGIPAYGGALDQDFALVGYNLLAVDLAVMAPVSHAVLAENCGLGNSAVDPDEFVTVAFVLRNIGTAATTNLTGTLAAAGGVVNPGAPFVFGAVAPGGTVTGAYTFSASGVCGGAITAAVSLVDGATGLGTMNYVIPMGVRLLHVLTNSTAGGILIPDSGTATPYPSSITVAAFPGALDKVRVVLRGLTHTWPGDLAVVLVGPGGQRVALMGNVGGSDNAVGAILTFDDEAAGSLVAPVVTGTYKPTGPVTFMPGPAPAGPYGSFLSVFNGTNPNGTWSLYVNDAFAGDQGLIGVGWSLLLNGSEGVCCASNQPPELAPLADVITELSNVVAFAVTATDVIDNDPITLTASNLPAGAIFGATNGVGSFLWATPDPIGVYTARFYAVDKDGFDMASVVIQVLPEGATGGVVFVETMGTEGAVVESIAVHESNNRFDHDEFTMSGLGDVRNSNPSSGSYDDASGSMNVALNGAGETFQIDGIDSTRHTQMEVRFGLRKSTTTETGSNLVVEVSNNRSTWTKVSPDVGWLPTGAGTAAWHYRTNAIPGTSFSVTNLSIRFRSLNAVDFRIDDLMLISHSGPPVPTPPILLPDPPKFVVLNTAVSFPVIALPTEADLVTLSAVGLPGDATFDSTNEFGTFSWTNAQPVGAYPIFFVATDDDGSTTNLVVIDVRAPPSVSNVWINEIHYDNLNIDVDEGVEIAGVAGIDLNNYHVIAYNGFDGYGYATSRFTGVLDDEGCGIGALWFPMPGLQDGTPDGLALMDANSNLLQFLSYEGSFTAIQPPAGGFDSDDILVGELNSTPIGYSLQLTGTGTNYPDFTWSAPTNASRGSLNADQIISPCVITNPDVDGDGISDAWEYLQFTNLTTAGIGSDYDSDGFPDSSESLAGTQPHDSNSFLRVVSVTNQVGPSYVIRWTSEATYTYVLSRATNLNNFVRVVSNLPGTPPINVYTDLPPVEAVRFYRVEMQ